MRELTLTFVVAILGAGTWYVRASFTPPPVVPPLLKD